jgi:DNA-binding XRE family transcriptional regulator
MRLTLPFAADMVSSMHTVRNERSVTMTSSEVAARIRQFRVEIMGQSMSELAREIGVSKTTIYRAENVKGKQVFNYKLLFGLIVHGASPDWLLLGVGHPSRHQHQAEVLFGESVKMEPETLRHMGQEFDWDRELYFPTKANEKLVRLLREVEALFLKSDESQREAITKVVGSMVGLLGRVSADDPSFSKARRARGYLRLGVVAEQEGKFDEALKCYKSAMALDRTSEATQRIQTIRQHMIGKEPGVLTEQRSSSGVISDAREERSANSNQENHIIADRGGVPMIKREMKHSQKKKP